MLIPQKFFLSISKKFRRILPTGNTNSFSRFRPFDCAFSGIDDITKFFLMFQSQCRHFVCFLNSRVIKTKKIALFRLLTGKSFQKAHIFSQVFFAHSRSLLQTGNFKPVIPPCSICNNSGFFGSDITIFEGRIQSITGVFTDDKTCFAILAFSEKPSLLCFIVCDIIITEEFSKILD